MYIDEQTSGEVVDDQGRRGPGGPDGNEIANRIGGHLDYLSRLARELGVPDPVEEYFAPVVGRWSDLEAEAGRWRQVGGAAAEVTDTLHKPLGRLDAGWDGEAADSFIAYMQQVGLAGQDLSDAMVAIAEVLEVTADGIREIVQQLGGVLEETASSASQAMVLPVQGDDRTRQYLDIMRRPTKELFDAVRQVLESFVQMCEGIDGSAAFKQIKMAHTFPEENWSFGTPGTPGASGLRALDARTGTSGASGADLAGIGAGAGGFGGASGASGVGGPGLGPGGNTVGAEQAPSPKPEVPAAASAAGGGSASNRMGGGMMPMAPMMGGMGQGGGGSDYRSRVRVTGDPQDIFGKPEKASAPVIGDDDY